jgi:hypothetical protein
LGRRGYSCREYAYNPRGIESRRNVEAKNFPHPFPDGSSDAEATLKEGCGNYEGMGEADGGYVVATLEEGCGNRARG